MTNQEPRGCCPSCRSGYTGSPLPDLCKNCPCHNPGKEEKIYLYQCKNKDHDQVPCEDCVEVPQEPQPVEEWEREFENEFVANRPKSLEPIMTGDIVRLKSFIRHLLSFDRERVRAQEAEIRLNEIKFVENLPHRCPGCGKASENGLTYGAAYKLNALFGRCPKCANEAMSAPTSSLTTPQQ